MELKRQISLEYTNEKEGHVVYLVEPMEARFRCPFCEKLMRNPIQTERGELSCEYCYTSNLGQDGICPIDKQMAGRYFKDKYKTREIQNLICFCIFKDNGCPWEGKVAEAEEHQSVCQYQPQRCFLCNTILLDISLEEHLRNCAKISAHENCYYAKYGCSKKPKSIDDHIIHLKENAFIHSQMQSIYLESMETTSEQIQNELASINNTLRHESTKMDAEIKLLNNQVYKLTENLKLIQDDFNKLQSEMEIMATTVSDSSNEASNTLLDELSTNVGETDKKLLEIDLKQQLFENTTYNGKMLWKIDNVKSRMQQAITGRVTALHSAPCFTEKYGFKFCARAYLNGDGMGKCTHLSLFLVIMKSEYDNLLNWPFTKKVTFRLLNQEDSMKIIEESFSADRFSSSFQKPKKDMNVAAGCPMFISRDDLLTGGYVKDDCIFIEVSVA